VEDCTEALQWDATNVKALIRRATVRAPRDTT
jgi:hypothetical protein